MLNYWLHRLWKMLILEKKKREKEGPYNINLEEIKISFNIKN